MRHSLLFAVLLAIAPLAFAQSAAPDKSAERAQIEQMNQRLRGSSINVTDEQTTPGKRRVDITEVQRRTDELNGLVKSVNFDLVNLRKGILAADLTEKLKRIEKLAKQLRQTLE